MLRSFVGLVALMAAVTAAGLWLAPRATYDAPRAASTSRPTDGPSQSPSPVKPLSGVVIVLDPGHQLGNRNHAREINQLVDAGGFQKPCNTTGTATNAGFPEATFTWQVSQIIRKRLVREGATVVMTRSANSDDLWGPCVDERGRAGDKHEPDLLLSLHADGVLDQSQRGFHVIVPETGPVAGESKEVGRTLVKGLAGAGLPPSTYVDGGLDVRADLGTLNLSSVPRAMIEFGNMRNAEDAELMTTKQGRQRYADGVIAGVIAVLASRG